MFQIRYPNTRLQRTRTAKWIRDLFAENVLCTSDLIQPYFIVEGNNIKTDIPTMPGIYNLSIDNLIENVKKAKELGINAIMLFPQIVPDKKSADAKEAYNSNNLMCQAIKQLKKQDLDIGIMADVALDPYTLNGHDGITDNKGQIMNDKTIDILCKQSLVLVEAGCDVIAPSDMMDGRIGKIRMFLEKKGFYNTKIISYAAKYASHFYGPFRDAIGSKNSLAKSDKQTYQMDIRNSKQALLEVGLDISEGADGVIIKPGMPYLDIIRSVKMEYNIPVIGYQVSGEYSMLKIAAKQGIFDINDAITESLISFKRAGACAIITYAAAEIAKILQKN